MALHIRRGLKADLPASAEAGQLLITTDTHELYVGTGSSIVLVMAGGEFIGTLGLDKGGTDADLSASGGTTKILAQDASHIISARDLIAGDIPSLPESKITGLVTDLSNKEAVANKDTDGTLASNSDTKYPSQKAAKTYVDGKASTTLSTAEGYTDTAIATEVTNRNTAIGVEVTNRGAAVSSAITTAENYTDAAIADEVTDRDTAIGVETSRAEAAEAAAITTAEDYTDTAIATEVTDRNTAIGVETTRAEAAEVAAISTAEGYTDTSIATEVTNRNTAIGVETSRAEAAEALLAPNPVNYKVLELVADDTTDNITAINAAIAALPANGGTIRLVPIGTGKCYCSDSIAISASGVCLIGTGAGFTASSLGNCVLWFAASKPGIIINNAPSCLLDNFTLLSKDTGAVSNDHGIWVKGTSSAVDLRRLSVRHFGDSGIRLDSSSAGNLNHWRQDFIFAYQNFGDGLSYFGGTDTNVGVATALNATANGGYGLNLDSGSSSNSFLEPHVSSNTTGGIRVNTGSNYFHNVYTESASVSSFIFTSSSNNNIVFFNLFGQPTTITNSGGTSNVFFYNASSVPGFANLNINSQTPGSGHSYRLTNGSFNGNDLAISDDTGATWLDFNFSLSALLALKELMAANIATATSGGSTNSGKFSFLGAYWNGSASVIDKFTMQVIGGTGTNGSSTLLITHTGSPGTASVEFNTAVIFDVSPTVPDNTALDNSSKVANTRYVDAAVGVETSRAAAAEGTIATSVSTETTRATAAEALKAPILTPVFSGAVAVPSGPLTVGQSTAAVAGVNQNSNTAIIEGKYWNGSSSVADDWIAQTQPNSGTATITHSVLTSNVLTITANHTFRIGNQVLINGSLNAALNGQTVQILTVIGTFPNYTGFTANLTNANITTATDTGTCVIVNPTSTLALTHSGAPGLPIIRAGARIQADSGFAALMPSSATFPLAVTNGGTGGAATWTYILQGVDANGFAISQLSGTTTTGNATLTGTNTNILTWANSVPGTGVQVISSYRIYRTVTATAPTTKGLIGTALGTATTFTDTGLAGDGSATLPNESGITLYTYYQDRYNWSAFRIMYDNSGFGGWQLGTTFAGNGGNTALEFLGGGFGWFIDPSNGVGAWTTGGNNSQDIGRYYQPNPPTINNISVPRNILAGTSITAAAPSLATVSAQSQSAAFQCLCNYWTGTTTASDIWLLRSAVTATLSATVTAVSVTTNVITVTCVNTFSVGQTVFLAGTAEAAVNNKTLTILTVSGSQFTAALTTGNFTNGADTGTVVLTSPASTLSLTHTGATGALPAAVNLGAFPITMGAITTSGHMQAGPVGGSANADLAGQATVLAAATTKAITFATTYLGAGQPVVILTPTTNPTVFYWVTYQGSANAWTGFTVNLASALGSNIVFNYQVIGQP